MAKISITPFKAWMFGSSIGSTAVVVDIIVLALADDGDLHGEHVLWLAIAVAVTMLLWIGAFTAVVRDAILAKLEERADRCQLVQDRLDEIEQELAADRAVITGQINGSVRRLHTVE